MVSSSRCSVARWRGGQLAHRHYLFCNKTAATCCLCCSGAACSGGRVLQRCSGPAICSSLACYQAAAAAVTRRGGVARPGTAAAAAGAEVTNSLARWSVHHIYTIVCVKHLQSQGPAPANTNIISIFQMSHSFASQSPSHRKGRD